MYTCILVLLHNVLLSLLLFSQCCCSNVAAVQIDATFCCFHAVYMAAAHIVVFQPIYNKTSTVKSKQLQNVILFYKRFANFYNRNNPWIHQLQTNPKLGKVIYGTNRHFPDNSAGEAPPSSPGEAPPIGKIHTFSKMAVTCEPLMGF